MLIKKLIERFLPNASQSFVWEIKPLEKRYFSYKALNGKIALIGDSNISIAMAFYNYLKKYLNANISWCGDRIDSFKALPMPLKEEISYIDQEYIVYMNYCTFSYSCAWWDWERWEREIDFMALNGINMPLIVVGLEKVWFNTLLKFDFTQKEALSFLSSPAYMAWQLMNNLEGELSPLNIEAINRRYELGKKIIDKMVQYGMKPIQQGFSGCVPTLLKDKRPDATIRIGAPWCAYKGTAQLDPLDPLFNEFGTILLKEQDKLFGSYHYYAADPFHESSPPEKGSDYLKNVGKTISEMFMSFDSEAVWVMQGWTPYKDIIQAISKDKLIILDLSGRAYRKHVNFYGYKFVVGNLHNFGGRINLHGDIRYVAKNNYKILKDEGLNVVGTGLFMEGINQNPLYYDLAFEVLSINNTINLNYWLKNYSRRRYGISDASLEKAMELLSNTVYKRGTNNVENSSIICARPALKPKKSGPNNGFSIPYDNKKLFKAISLFMENYDNCQNYNFLFDISDLIRQNLSNYGQSIIKNIKKAYILKNLDNYRKNVDEFMGILKDIDIILSPLDQLSFYKWQGDAVNSGVTKEDKKINIIASKQLLTIWGPNCSETEPEIFDYSWREWGGLIKHFYSFRWQKFFDYIEKKLINKEKYCEKKLPKVYGREKFKANDFYIELAQWEKEFVNSEEILIKSMSKVDVKDIYDKYKSKKY